MHLFYYRSGASISDLGWSMGEESEWSFSYSHYSIVEGGFERSSNEKINAARTVRTQDGLLIQVAVTNVVLVTSSLVARAIDQNNITTIGIE